MNHQEMPETCAVAQVAAIRSNTKAPMRAKCAVLASIALVRMGFNIAHDAVGPIVLILSTHEGICDEINHWETLALAAHAIDSN